MIPSVLRRSALPLSLLALLTLSAACRRQVVETRPTIPLVREILADKSGPRMQMLRDLQPKPASDITLIGSDFACERLAEQFYFRDLKDNVDARFEEDGLPDFSGETFACIEDSLDYRTFVAAGQTEELRRQTVMRVLAALDTVVHISPYDLEGLATKASSKMIVLADPFLAEYGGFDVDTLLQSTGCGIPVIRPIELMIDRAFEVGGRWDLSVGIICDPRFADSRIYERIFARKAAERGAKGASCVVMGVAERDSVLHHFLSDYLEAGNTKPLDAILIDDLAVRPDSLKNELADIVSVMNESSMTFGRLISRNFVFLDTFDSVADCCYALLRENNLFTHNIAKPQVSVYRPVRKPESGDGSIILIPGSYVQN